MTPPSTPQPQPPPSGEKPAELNEFELRRSLLRRRDVLRQQLTHVEDALTVLDVPDDAAKVCVVLKAAVRF